MSHLLLESSRELAEGLNGLTFQAPVTHVYNPLDYAWEPFQTYVERYAGGRKRFVVLGMNPGPWGMAQTGVPFGEVEAVTQWLGISGKVEQPARLHPQRPISGFATTRREVSGQRVWGWAKDRYGTPDAFFQQAFVLNYCPLLFFDESGTNITPDKLKQADRQAVHALCDKALRQQILALEASALVALGRFAEARGREALAGLPVQVVTAPHPSPANPAANAGWSRLMDEVIGQLGPNSP